LVSERLCAQVNKSKIAVAVIVASSVVVFSVGAAISSSTRIFGTGEVTVSKDGRSAHIVNDSGEYGGVYRQAISKKLLRKLVHLTFTTTADSDVTGGAPRWSIPVNTDSDANTTEGYAFIDVNGCGGSAGVPTVVATANANCHVNFQGVDYANWQAFCGKNGGAHPTYTLAKFDGGEPTFPFIIADEPGNYTVTNIRLSS
jgi:hypothetical protein